VPAPSLRGFYRVVLAAPVHERRHPTEFEVFLAGCRSDLEEVDTLLISVSLSAAFPEGKPIR
jgi:menaquinone-dependent protoporphyrinogen oxidase